MLPTFDLAADVTQDERNVFVKVHVPGINPNSIHIGIEGHNLHIAASREEEKETKAKHYFHREIREGHVERIIGLPCAVDNNNVTAEINNGVLNITLPKIKTGNNHSIKITRK